MLEKDTSSSAVMGTFNCNAGEQWNTSWSFISLQCEVWNQPSWMAKTEPKPMMEVSLVLSVRLLHDWWNHLLSDSKISGCKNLERELIYGDNEVVCMSNFSSLAEKQKHWLQETLILMVLEIKSLATTKVPFNLSMTNHSTSAAFCWELKLNGAWRDSEILWVMAHEKFDGSTGLLDLDFSFMFWLVDFLNGGKGEDKDDDSGTLFQSNG